MRIKFVGRQHYLALKKKKKPFVITLWHGRILLPIYVHRGEGIRGMASLSQDGRMVAQTILKLGYRIAWGSSSRRGKEALHELAAALKRGEVGALIPDGPRGPRHRLKMGAIVLSLKTGAFLLPLTYAATRRTVFRSWDRFYLPWPSSRCVIMYGEPIWVSPDLSDDALEAFRKQVEERMIALEREADEFIQNYKNSKGLVK